MNHSELKAPTQTFPARALASFIPMLTLDGWRSKLTLGDEPRARHGQYGPICQLLNVTKYLDRLQFERNPTVLTSLQTLLLEEVNKSDFSLDWLGTEQRYAVERIALQKALIGRSTTDGRDMRLARDNRLGQ